MKNRRQTNQTIEPDQVKSYFHRIYNLMELKDEKALKFRWECHDCVHVYWDRR